MSPAPLKLLLIACLALTVAASSLRGEAVDDTGLWTALFANGDLDLHQCSDDRLKWWFDAHLRLFDDAGGFGQSIIRPGVGWTVSENSTLWAGYGWINTSPGSRPAFDEHRLWQQWTWGEAVEEWKFAHRSRFEQRWLETGDDVGLRYRALFRAQHDLPQFPRLSLVAWDELFYHLNDTDWGATSGFDQNRAFLGLGYKPTPNTPWRLEVGYLNQTIEVAAGDDRSNHILSLNLFVSP